MSDHIDGRINLTDEQWMSMIDSERDGLPVCCGVVSEMRDIVATVARFGGKPMSVGYLKEKLVEFRGYHAPEEMSATFAEFARQVEAL